MSGGAETVSADLSPEPVSASYDSGRRRRTLRRGRERGCWLYIPADELQAAGYALSDPPPWYRVWGSKRGVCIRLYKKGDTYG